MKLTVTYEVSGEELAEIHPSTGNVFLRNALYGPLRTGTEAANAQLKAENKKLRLKLIDAEVE